MKSIKAKLFASLAMLLIAAVLMTSASFAWFTVSTAPEVSTLDVTMEAVQNFEIAMASTGADNEVDEVTVSDTGDDTNWGSTVTSFTAQTLNFPATYSSGIKTVTYDDSGRTAGLTADALTWTLADGQALVTTDVEGFMDDAAVAAVYGVWLRSNTAGTASASFTGNADSNEFLKVYAKVGTSYVELSGTAAEIATVTANTEFLVEIIVFFDGDSMYAEDVAEDMQVDDIVISFTHSVVGASA